MPLGTAAAGLPATFQMAAYAIAGIDASDDRTVPLPSMIPSLGGRCAMAGVSRTSRSSKTRLVLALIRSVCLSANSMTRGVTQLPSR